MRSIGSPKQSAVAQAVLLAIAVIAIALVPQVAFADAQPGGLAVGEVASVDDVWAASDEPLAVYRFRNDANGDHLFTADEAEQVKLLAAGWVSEGEVWVSADDTTRPVYRLRNPEGSTHLFTADKTEWQALVGLGWISEGEASWYAQAGGQPAAQAVYRLYNDRTGKHHLTTSQHEYRALLDGGWVYEGIAFYQAVPDGSLSPAIEVQLVNVYRMFNQYTEGHFFTASKDERDVAVSRKWRYEGIAWRSLSFSFTPVYRLLAPWSGEHFYTSNLTERLSLAASGWNPEGVAWFEPDDKKGSATVLRLFNPSLNFHMFTLSESERQSAAGSGYYLEGAGWAGYSPDPTFVDDMQPWHPDPSGDAWLDGRIKDILSGHPTLRSAFDFVTGYRYRNGDRYWSNPHYLSDGLTIDLATDMIVSGSGNCYRYASLFSWLARGLGYETRVVSGWVPSYSGGRAPHGWVEVYVDGRTYVCDPDMSHDLPGYNWYMVTYASAPVNYGSW